MDGSESPDEGLSVAEKRLEWWQRGIVYQVYPRSFQDSNGDGVGDLAGITARLDHLRWLGVDAVWISPFYPSPMADFGYDVTDYCGVDPIFGTLADFDALLEEAHRLDLRVMLDLIPNHTSERHPWFVESRSSRDNPRRDWYVWRDPAPGGGPPNNWISAFGGSVWQWDEATEQYYLHIYLREQPDLNWRNPAVEAAIHQAMRFWLDRGIDGFRVDAVQNIVKDEHFRDNPPNPAYRTGMDPYDSLLRTYSQDRPEVHEKIVAMRRVLDSYGPGKVLIGEIYNAPERLMPYYGTAGDECHFPYNFQLVKLPWDARTIDTAVRTYEGMLPPDAWPNWVLGNHDRPRIASRVGAAQARVAAMLLLTLRGTPTLYYGDEIGMTDVPIPPGRERDPWGINLPGLGLGRDPERTPMQWSAAPHAGFTTAHPWLPIAHDFAQVNLEAQRVDAESILTLHRRLIAVRRAEPALHGGAYTPIDAIGPVIAYQRTAGDSRLLVALNLSSDPASLALPDGVTGIVEIATHADADGRPIANPIHLRGDEGLLMRLRA
jgi:alpha-glucosidase